MRKPVRKAVIPAAGFGTRFLPATKSQPKEMLPIVDKPTIQYIIEEAIAYKRLLEEFNLKQDEVAERVSKSRTAVTNSMRLLKLTNEVQQMVIDDMLTTGHARALISITDPEKQYSIAQKIFDEKLSVRETEKLIKKMQNEKKNSVKKETPVDPKMDIIYQDLEEKMKHILGTKVMIHKKDAKKGTIEIEYYSPEELDRIIELFQSIKNI